MWRGKQGQAVQERVESLNRPGAEADDQRRLGFAPVEGQRQMNHKLCEGGKFCHAHAIDQKVLAFVSERDYRGGIISPNHRLFFGRCYQPIFITGGEKERPNHSQDRNQAREELIGSI